MEQMWAPWRMEYILSEVDNSSACIFCEFPKKNDDEKFFIVYRSEHSFVILNKFPYNNGHAMVVPYQHCSDITELDDDCMFDMQKTIRKTVRMMKNIIKPHGFNLGMNIGRVGGAGIDQHLHYHIVPRWNGDTNFMPVIANTKVVSESLRATWKKFKAGFENLNINE
jgi:ATP adenylyltransferase